MIHKPNTPHVVMVRFVHWLMGMSVLFAGCVRGPAVEEIAATDAGAIADAPHVEVAQGDWPWWRGPNRDGTIEVAQEESPPTSFSPNENVLWKVPIPGRGHGSPIVCGQRVFLATADEEAPSQSLLCFAREDGALLWETTVHTGELPYMHRKNSHASATPTCDGERVFITFAVDDAVWASALSFDGEILWQREVGPFSSKHGYGASPCIYKSAVIVAADHQGEGYIAALDRETGEILWRTSRLRGASFATPIVAHVAGRDQLLLSGQDRVVSYDPATGEEIWWCAGSANSTANTMAWNQTHVFATGGWHQKGILCIRADGEGDVTDTHIAWEISGMKVYVPSPVVAGEVLVAARDDGIVVGVDVDNGDIFWKKRLERGVEVSASPTLISLADGDAADNLVYLPNEAGQVFVFRPTKEFDYITSNDMGDSIYATPVVAGGRIYLRTFGTLYCVGE